MELRFTPYAYAKIQYMRDKGDTEVAGYGICERDPLLITDFRMVKQECSAAFVEMDGESFLDVMEEYAAKGLKMEQVGRIWIHTHPGNSAKPSGTDEKTFKDLWGNCSWSVMAILANGGDTYARLQYQTKPPEFLGFKSLATEILTWAIDYSEDFQASDKEAWDAEYQACWSRIVPVQKIGFTGDGAAFRKYKDSEARWWEKRPKQSHWWEEDPCLEDKEKLWEGDEFIAPEDYRDTKIELPPYEETLYCKECQYEWPYFEGGCLKLEECPNCKSTMVDFTPPRHRQRKTKKRRAK